MMNLFHKQCFPILLSVAVAQECLANSTPMHTIPLDISNRTTSLETKSILSALQNYVSKDFLNQLVTRVISATPYELERALQELMPNRLVSIHINDLHNHSLDAVMLRQHSIREDFCPNNYNIGKVNNKMDYWSNNFGMHSKQDAINNLFGYKSDAKGVIVGVDNYITARLSMGFASNYTKSKLQNYINQGTYSDIHSYQVFSYGSYKYWHTYIDWTLTAAFNRHHSYREVQGFMNPSISAATFNSKFYAVRASCGQRINIKNIAKLLPVAQIKLAKTNLGCVTEQQGGEHNLFITYKTNSKVKLESGTYFIIPFGDEKIFGQQEFHAFVHYDVKRNYTVTTANFLYSQDLFAANITAQRVGVQLGSNLKYNIKNNLQLGINYDIELRRRYTHKNVNFECKYIL